MSKQIWAYIDHFKGEPLTPSWETIGAAQMLAEKLGGEAVAVILGSGMDAAVQTAFHYGAAKVIVADDPTLNDYRPEPYVETLAAAARGHNPAVILFPTTTRGRELAAMAGAALDAGVIADIIDMDVVDGKIVTTRPVYAGKLLAKAVAEGEPQIITLRVRAFAKPEADESRSGEVVKVAAALSEDDIATKVVEYATTEGGVSLTEAAIIVSGGRGVSNNPDLAPPPDITDENEIEIWRAKQGFKLIGELAETLGAAVGASRAAVDAGYIPYDHQVGQTGKVVSPDLYIACGISGAIQHQAGMRNSKVIVAINTDPEAPIFKLARYGVVGDLWKIVPALNEAFKKKLGKA